MDKQHLFCGSRLQAPPPAAPTELPADYVIICGYGPSSGEGADPVPVAKFGIDAVRYPGRD